MKKISVLVASDSYKGSLTSQRIAEIFDEQARRFEDVDVCCVPIADGGEGTLAAITAVGGFSLIKAPCKNPLFEDITAEYAANDKGQAFVEMAQASGLTLIPYADGNAAVTTTYGTGQLICDAIRNGAKEIYVSVGGSATNDGGIGALCAMGFVFEDKYGNSVLPVGKNLGSIVNVRRDNCVCLDGVTFTVLADVDNPLVGKRGATRFYGKQKGAVGIIADELEDGMIKYADFVQKATGVRLHNMAHAGAAGGLAGGLIAFLGATVKSGIATVLRLIDFDKYLCGATAVVTGEGRLDAQSLHGKAVCGICEAAKARNVPVYVMAGCTTLDKGEWQAAGIKDVVTLREFAANNEDSIKNAERYATLAATSLLNTIRDITINN